MHTGSSCSSGGPQSSNCARTFAWRDDPFALVTGGEPEGGAVYAAADYLVAYWLGRATGFVAPGE